MTNNYLPIVVDYYSDVLCIWAWIAQPRLEELHRQWGEQVVVRHRYVDIFGDTQKKIPEQWGEPNGYKNFHVHLAKSVAPFEEVTIHPGIWTQIQPRTSMTAHLFLRAVDIVAGSETLAVATKAVREHFFSRGGDIGQMSELFNIANELKLDTAELEAALGDGSAMAALSFDLRSANEMGIKGSPTWVLNGGRQLLYGNVGYRILNANIEELLKNPIDEASWC